MGDRSASFEADDLAGDLTADFGMFQSVGQVYNITGGGPANSTRPIIQYIYESAFEKGKMGYAASMSYVLFGILLVFSLIQQKIQRKGESK